jgi:exodeoxyribonuclease VIII
VLFRSVVINDTGNLIDTLYVERDFSCITMFTDDNTLRWWMQQSDEARQVFQAKTPEFEFTDRIGEFYDRWMPQVEGVWGYGADFDNVLYNSIADAHDLAKIPYKKSRCLRTLAALFPDVERPEFRGSKHIAIDDAVYEAEYLTRLLARVRGSN